MTAIDDLVRLCPPPAVDRARNGRALGAAPPAHYKRLAETYGAGVFDETVRPLAPDADRADCALLAQTAERDETLASLWGCRRHRIARPGDSGGGGARGRHGGVHRAATGRTGRDAGRRHRPVHRGPCTTGLSIELYEAPAPLAQHLAAAGRESTLLHGARIAIADGPCTPPSAGAHHGGLGPHSLFR